MTLRPAWSLLVLIGCSLPHGDRARAANDLLTDYPPLGHRVTVEVLNAAKLPGAARAAAVLLRRAGLDVVYLGNADPRQVGRDTTLILVRGADTSGAGRAAEVLRGARIVVAPDSTHLVDLTIELGRDFSAGPLRAR